jgi:hypothetical protein
MRSRPSLSVATLLAVLALSPVLWPAVAHAQTPAAEDQRSALYKEGVELANAGRWDEAVKRFRQVVAIRSAPPALYTLGQAEEHLGELATAERTYERALTDARASGATEVAEAAQKALSGIEPRVPRAVIKLTKPADGATATIDGLAVALGEPKKVNPGTHTVSVQAPGKHPFDARIRLAEGQSVDVPVTLETEGPTAALPAAQPPAPVTSPPPPPPAEPETGGHSSFPIGPVILGGAGLVAGVVGVVVRLGGQSSYDTANNQCGPSGCPNQHVVDDGNSARSQMVLGTVVLGVGIAAVVGAGVWWAVTPRHSSSSATQARAGFGLVPTRDGARASFVGTF